MSKQFNRRDDRYQTVPAAEAEHRSIAPVELLTTAALALSTAVAVTAVSIGMARADVIGSVNNGDSAPLAIAALIGLLFSGVGGLTALIARDSAPQG
jgi:hypothetical protein